MLASFAEHGLEASVVRASTATAEAAAAATERIVARPRTADAIVAFNDLCAIGVLSACRRAGVDVPGDVRVVGIDGLALGRLLAPTLDPRGRPRRARRARARAGDRDDRGRAAADGPGGRAHGAAPADRPRVGLRPAIPRPL
ncbi:substrate-binding domain-containing protein [Rathayibacter oskolensis]|uniref:substrate-binding domain-containing protein n=1 Tax=Rathayibacter oskolensis TaxID=1891671 RepID=UPI00265DD7C4|nr:substrate-binding domain-containing protein [Rathayibacter oskolensis]WKK73287.1 substrate-binding domain-containing protein [Rathayibacter oskolensis]